MKIAKNKFLSNKGGMWKVLKIALPLILTDQRDFLTRHSELNERMNLR